MNEFIKNVLNHPIATSIAIGAVADCIVRIVNVAKGNNAAQ